MLSSCVLAISHFPVHRIDDKGKVSESYQETYLDKLLRIVFSCILQKSDKLSQTTKDFLFKSHIIRNKVESHVGPYKKSQATAISGHRRQKGSYISRHHIYIQ